MTNETNVCMEDSVTCAPIHGATDPGRCRPSITERTVRVRGWSKVQRIVLDRALACARGDYQRAIILGGESLSGSTLRGTAKSYGYHYRASSKNLLSRIEAAGIRVREERGKHGARILLIGDVGGAS